MRLGAFDHLTKPIGRVELDALLKRLPQRADPPAACRRASESGTLIGSSEAMRARAEDHRSRRRQRRDCADPRRDRNRQGTRRPRACMSTARARQSPLSRSTARPYPRTCWRANFSGTCKAPSPAPLPTASARFAKPRSGTLFLDEIGDMPAADAGQNPARHRGARRNAGRRQAHASSTFA